MSSVCVDVSSLLMILSHGASRSAFPPSSLLRMQGGERSGQLARAVPSGLRGRLRVCCSQAQAAAMPPSPAVAQRQPDFGAVATTPEPSVRQATYRGLSSDELAHRLQAAEDELCAHRLQAAKRLSLHLNKRLMTLIQQWKEVQAQLESPDQDDAAAGALRARAAKLAAAITEQRRIVEEALQLMITLQPSGVASPAPTMSLSAKARFQGTPVATLKAVPVSDAWLQTLVT